MRDLWSMYRLGTLIAGMMVATTAMPGFESGGTVAASPASLTFNAVVNSAAPAAQSVSVTAPRPTQFEVHVDILSGGTNWLSVSPTGTVTTNRTLSVSVNPAGLAAGSYSARIALAASGGTTTVPVALVVNTATGGGSTSGYKIISWNDLGMHCDDGKDYSVFGVLPPYNTIHAHLIDSTGKLVAAPAGYTITYQAVNDPLTNTFNTTSTLKTNFWQFASALGFGVLNPDQGLKGYSMPGIQNKPQAMAFSTADNTWVAEGIPITNYPDSATGSYTAKNYFPMMRIVAKNAAGSVLASTDVVLPISDEMTCSVCHSSKSVSSAAMPAAGWVNNSDPAKDVKLNILRLHDQLSASRNQTLFASALLTRGYSASGLEATATTMKPILCGSCHATNALGLAGVTGVPALTSAMHGQHATVVNPSTNATLDAGSTRDTCYLCHPGPNTQCLRGAMATLTNPATGSHAVECQSCHGTMSTVANSSRNGWFDEPNCQGCHTGTATSNAGQIVYTSVFSSGTTPRVVTNTTFATNPNTPVAGVSLYRFSKGHGGLQCEACHGSTHAEFPTPIVNDNAQSVNLQGHAGMLVECTACHASTPDTVSGGPHGLHPVGASWVSRHGSIAEHGGSAACQACHGTDYRGTILSKAQADRTLAGKTFARGTVIGCYSCHNGPNGS